MTILCKVALTTEAEGDVQRRFPPASCLESSGCASCETGISGLCNGTAEFDFLERIMAAMSKSEVLQEKILDRLRLCADSN